MALTADEEEELAELKARRRASAGIRSTTFADQSTTFDPEGLDKRIAELENKGNASRTRYAATSKGI